MSPSSPTLRWLEPGDVFPPVEEAWNAATGAPGLLAGGGDLSVGSLLRAYGNGIFPWFSEGQPILWWSPDPRMVLNPAHFKLHRSLRRTVARFIAQPDCEVRFNTDFARVITACANSARHGQAGTWIQPDVLRGYVRLHQAGYAHSVETWVNGQLAGGLYCVAIGQAVFGESMFTTVPDASKIALAALVCFCREHAIGAIDCQQNTAHLASLGAAEMPRQAFLDHIRQAQRAAPLNWRFSPLYWNNILSA